MNTKYLKCSLEQLKLADNCITELKSVYIMFAVHWSDRYLEDCFNQLVWRSMSQPLGVTIFVHLYHCSFCPSLSIREGETQQVPLE